MAPNSSRYHRLRAADGPSLVVTGHESALLITRSSRPGCCLVILTVQTPQLRPGGRAEPGSSTTRAGAERQTASLGREVLLRSPAPNIPL